MAAPSALDENRERACLQAGDVREAPFGKAVDKVCELQRSAGFQPSAAHAPIYGAEERQDERAATLLGLIG